MDVAFTSSPIVVEFLVSCGSKFLSPKSKIASIRLGIRRPFIRVGSKAMGVGRRGAAKTRAAPHPISFSCNPAKGSRSEEREHCLIAGPRREHLARTDSVA
jgi:hypothetical protein